MGTTQQKIPDPKADKAYADWEAEWQRDLDHKIQEKKALVQIVMAGLEYLRLTQQKLVQELEELATAKPPVVPVPDLGKPWPPGTGPIANFEAAESRPPEGGPPKPE